VIWRIDVTAHEDPEARRVVSEASLMGIAGLAGCTFSRVYHLRGELQRSDAERLCRELLVDPVLDSAVIEQLDDGACNEARAQPTAVEVAALPGVTDVAAREIERAAQELGLPQVRATTARRYVLDGTLSAADTALAVRRVLANPTIERWARDRLSPVFEEPSAPSERVESVAIADLDDDGLQALSRDRVLSLDLAELRAIREHFRAEGRDPTDGELETLAQTWSEHCVHKTFRARIELLHTAADGTVTRSSHDGLLKTLRQATEELDPPWLRSAFVDDAGIVAFDEEFDLAFKVETHNHPSALEPFGGANTGIGGVVRDVLGVSARPIACTDVLCFGPRDTAHDQLPEGVLHPRRVSQGVIAGIGDYGNKLGLPTVNGAVLYDPGYIGNPLVFCGALGLLPHGSHRTEAQRGDLIVCIGGRVGRDGIHGATFSSAAMDSATVDTVGAVVQIGDPITEKGLIEVIERARDGGLYNAVTDCGAGGLSSAVGEMGERLGADIDLAGVPLKYPGLAPWEIWVSEAQERMVLAVPPDRLDSLDELCADFDVDLTVLGRFSGSRRLRVRHGDRDVVDLPMGFLHDGLPTRTMSAAWKVPEPTPADLPKSRPEGAGKTLLALLAHPDVASKEDIVRRYDHEVRGGTVVRPFMGPCADGPADAAVLKPLGTAGARAVVLANGICPRVGRTDPWAMAMFAIDEAVRNLVAVGGDPDQVALLDNFCWGDPTKPDRLGSLVLAVQGCAEGSRLYRMPFVSGKDSLHNEFEGAAVPGTLLISALGIVPDLHRAIHSAGMQPGDDVWLTGSGTAALGGSLADQVLSLGAVTVPDMLADPLALYRAVHAAVSCGLASAAHDCSDGGPATALAEMAIGARTGMDVTIPVDQGGSFEALFGEAPGRLVITAAAANRSELSERLAGHARLVGTVTDDDRLRIASAPAHIGPQSGPGLAAATGSKGQESSAPVDLALADLVAAFKTSASDAQQQ